MLTKQFLKPGAYTAWRVLKVSLSDALYISIDWSRRQQPLKRSWPFFLALLMVLVYAAAFMYCKSTHKLKHKSCFVFFFPWDAMVFHVNWKRVWQFYKKKINEKSQNTHSRCLSKSITRLSHIWALHITAVVFSFCRDLSVSSPQRKTFKEVQITGKTVKPGKK